MRIDMGRWAGAALLLSCVSGVLSAGSASAGVCVGNCGTLGADGVVTLSPGGGSSYQWISTAGGTSGAGRVDAPYDPTVSYDPFGSNGSQYTTDPFSASGGDTLSFYFNYVSADGEFGDYAWAQLQTTSGTPLVTLFTVGNAASGNASPAPNFPGSNNATLTPSSASMTNTAPLWSPLGADSGHCDFGAGCGYTDWIHASYTFLAPGLNNYVLTFGVANFDIPFIESGLAFDQITVIDPPPAGVPEPSSWTIMLLGFAGLGWLMKHTRLAKALQPVS
jgi:hypothetical protein